VPPEQAGFMVGALVGGLFAGLVCGALPLYVAEKRGRKGLGAFALVICVLSGMFLGCLLALPIALMFTFFFLAIGRSDRPGAPQPPPRPRLDECVRAVATPTDSQGLPRDVHSER